MPCRASPLRNYEGLTSGTLGLCKGRRAYDPKQVCDYSSVRAAKRAQSRIFNACMRIDGWQRMWEKFPVPSTQIQNSDKKGNLPLEKTNGTE